MNKLNGSKLSDVVQPLLTDFYQLTMAYAYWKAGKINDHSVFDLFFRKCPFKGEYANFSGLNDCLEFLQRFKFSEEDVQYLRREFPQDVEEEFFQYLLSLNANDVVLYSVAEGTCVFPKVPLIRVEGPLIVCQLLETTFLTLVNFASLVTTNASRFRLAAGPTKQLLEFGLRRAQGPDGGLSASRYCFVGGFDGTSNVLAGKLFDIPVKGTHAHAFVTSFQELNQIPNRILRSKQDGESYDFINKVEAFSQDLEKALSLDRQQAKEGELAAFVAYGLAFPDSFLALVDTYNVLQSGVFNFLLVVLALNDLGYQAIGVRIDSGDLAYLSLRVRDCFEAAADYFHLHWLKNLTIVASNDINEDTIHSLNLQGHSIDSLGIGTHLVTCQKQPALGCVYKLVEVNSRPTIKLSEDVEKITLPGRKHAYRIYGQDGLAILDLLLRDNEEAPQLNRQVLARHPFQATKRVYVKPARIENLLSCYWKNGKLMHDEMPDLLAVRDKTTQSLMTLRTDHKRFLNPTPYKVSVSDDLYKFTEELWQASAPIVQLS